jgi:hypothetical protein
MDATDAAVDWLLETPERVDPVDVILELSGEEGFFALRTAAEGVPQIAGGAHEATGCGVAGVLGVHGADREGVAKLGPLSADEPPRGVPGRPIGSCGVVPPNFPLSSRCLLASGTEGAGGAIVPLAVGEATTALVGDTAVTT